MAHVADQTTLVPTNNAFSFKAEGTLLWRRIALGVILLTSVYVNFFQLGQNGFGNLYYAAGVRSMADNWHNFFFVSFDPGGYVAIDKPALGLWVQALSVRLFGFTPFSVFLPQAISGVLAALLLYSLVRRHFGAIAGLISALALVVSPISVATDRNNTMDGTLALVLLLSVWAIIHACETGKLRWLLLSSVFVGLGFNIKMSAAYLIVPALGLAYLLCTQRKLRTRIWHLLVALVVMLVISLSWAVVVDLMPAAQRPFVGSTKDNSELGLAIAYNGVGRLNVGNNGNQNKSAAANQDTAAQKEIYQENPSGPFRLFDPFYGSQIAWLLPFALFAVLALAWRRRSILGNDRHMLSLITWGGWLLTMTIFFTIDGSFHQYYLVIMAPAICALVGIGLIVMWRQYTAGGWLLPIALAITAETQLYLLAYYRAWFQRLSLLIAVSTVLVILALIIFRFLQRRNSRENRFRVASVMVGIGMFALLLAPTIWSSYTALYNNEGADPIAGPKATDDFSNFLFANITHTSKDITKTDGLLISYLKAHQGKAQFLLATPTEATADALIIATNKPVMAVGGYGGYDPVLKELSDLQKLIKTGTIRFFLVNAAETNLKIKATSVASAGTKADPGNAKLHALFKWVGNNCKAVSIKSWRSSNTSVGNYWLYDCASLQI